jgi:hypothetical protein
MYRIAATLLLSLAEASSAERSGMSHCVPQSGHANEGVTQQSEDCDSCEMRYCLGMASCAHSSVAVVPMKSIDFTPAGELAPAGEGPSSATYLIPTPLPPPPKP